MLKPHASDLDSQDLKSEWEKKRELSRNAAALDAALVKRFNAGDESAFVEIYHRYREKILSIALSVLRNHTDAEEIAQDTFLRAHRGLAKFRGESSLATWLHRVTLNLARNRYWYFHRRRRHDTLSLDCPLSADGGAATLADLMPTRAPNPSRVAMTEEFAELVTLCMEKLPAAHREILAMRNLLNRSYDEIASALEIEVGTVKSRLARARGQLFRQISALCPEFGEDAATSDWFEPSRPGPGGLALG